MDLEGFAGKIILFSATLSQKPYFRIEFRIPLRWIFFILHIMHLGSSVPIFSSKLDEPLFGLSTLRVLPYAPACNCAAYRRARTEGSSVHVQRVTAKCRDLISQIIIK